MTLFTRRSPSKAARTIAVALVWASVFFMLGYFPMVLTRDARVGVVVLAAAIIPFGATAAGVIRGLLRGLGLGLVNGAGMVWGMLVARTAPPNQLDRLALKWFLASVLLAAAVASLFAILAQRRRQRLDREWRG